MKKIITYIQCLGSIYAEPVKYPKVIHPEGDLDIAARDIREIKAMIAAEQGVPRKGPVRARIDSFIVALLIIAGHVLFLLFMNYLFENYLTVEAPKNLSRI